MFKKHRFISRKKMDGEDVYKKLTNSHDGVLLKYSGSLFVNNLYCDPKSNKDSEGYRKLAKFIRDGGIAVKWVVVYASNRKNFPDLFKRQFKMVSLESEVEKTIGIDRDRKLLKHKEKEKKKKRRQRIPDNKFKQLCKKSKRTLPKRIRRKNIFQRGVGDVKIA